VPEQEFLPPRRSARSYRPDQQDEEPPPWANLPPVRPARPRGPGAPGRSGGPPAGAGGRPEGEHPMGPRRPVAPQRPMQSPRPEAQRPMPPQGPGAQRPTAPQGPGAQRQEYQRPEYQRPDSGGQDGPRQEFPRQEFPRRDSGRQDAPRQEFGRQAAAEDRFGPPDPVGLTEPGIRSGQDAARQDEARADELGMDEPGPQWAAGEAGDGEDVPAPQPREPGGRAARSAARRRRRWLVMGGALVVMAGAVVAVVLLTGGGPGPAAVTPGALITTFQPGELRQVPQACKVVPAATVQQYLPGKVKQAAPLPVNGSAGSACNWTLDQAPTYRLMELSIFAYAPNGLATGDGSATNAAIDGYASDLQSLQSPPKESPAPKAKVTMLPGFGNQAFSAMQVFRAGGAITDVATVVVRYHNVLVTATLNGLEHSNRGTYGPVSQSALSAAALAFAQAAEASLH
jgi:hypothetical protein